MTTATRGMETATGDKMTGGTTTARGSTATGGTTTIKTLTPIFDLRSGK